MSRSLWLALCLFGAMASVRADQDLAIGDAALAKFDLPAALKAYRAAHAQSPDSYEATWKLARALADTSTLSKDPAEQKQCCIDAEQLARTAVKLNPDDSKGHAYLAVAVGKLALYEGGKRKVELASEVQTEAERAIKRNDKEDLAYHVLGVWNREMVELNWVLRKFAELIYGKFPAASWMMRYMISHGPPRSRPRRWRIVLNLASLSSRDDNGRKPTPAWKRRWPCRGPGSRTIITGIKRARRSRG